MLLNKHTIEPFIRDVTDLRDFKSADIRSAIAKSIKPTEIDIIQLNILNKVIDQSNKAVQEHADCVILDVPDREQRHSSPDTNRFVGLWHAAYAPIESTLLNCAIGRGIQFSSKSNRFSPDAIQKFTTMHPAAPGSNISSSAIIQNIRPISDHSLFNHSSFNTSIKDLRDFKASDIQSALSKGVKPTEIDVIQLNILNHVIEQTYKASAAHSSQIIIDSPDMNNDHGSAESKRFNGLWKDAFRPLQNTILSFAISNNVQLNSVSKDFTPDMEHRFSSIPSFLLEENRQPDAFRYARVSPSLQPNSTSLEPAFGAR